MKTYNFNRKQKNFGIKIWDEREFRKDFPCIKIPRENDEIAKDLCESKFGDNWIWASPIQQDYTLLYFKSTEDAIIFKLSYQSVTT